MRKNNIFSRKILALPYAVFMILFVVIPLFLIVAYAFTDESGKSPLFSLAAPDKETIYNILSAE